MAADSISDVMLNIAQVAVTALTAAGLEPNTVPVVYHGPIPDDIACDDGRVSVWWNGLTGQNKFPVPSEIHNCAGLALLDVKVRWTRCWPIEPKYVPAHSALATLLADGAWVMYWAYVTFMCGDGDPIEGLARKGLAVIDTQPRKPMGGAAGVDVHLRVSPYISGSASSAADPG